MKVRLGETVDAWVVVGGVLVRGCERSGGVGGKVGVIWEEMRAVDLSVDTAPRRGRSEGQCSARDSRQKEV